MLSSPNIPQEYARTLRAHPLNPRGEFVVYWMQSSVRCRDNLALLWAQQQAKNLRIPLVVFFELIDNYPEANLRHYTFLIEGLKDVEQTLRAKNIPLFVGIKNNTRHITLSSLATKATVVVTDRGYTRFQRAWRKEVALTIPCALWEIESDVIVPVETASPKEEYTAATLRKKIAPLIPRFLEMRTKTIEVSKMPPTNISFPSLSLTSDTKEIARSLAIDKSIPPSPIFSGGESKALDHLEHFLHNRLQDFAKNRNRPELEATSDMSPYLHFGHISPSTILLVAQKHTQTDDLNYTTLLEELVVRRELSMNFVHYNSRYDSFSCLPNWAQKTLAKHAKDPREYTYSREQFEHAKTHDPYWNAAQNEMLATGKMHGYMRMYWGKKILEWSPSPEEAFYTALFLNNRYELDGRDPNGFAGVAWCFGKHDRPWTERPIFGMVRYMNDKGLERKFDIKTYARKWSSPPSLSRRT